MAGRILNRRELRKQADSAEQQAPAAAEAGAAAPAAPAKKKAAKPRAAAGPKKSRKKAPVRLCARWGVFDSGMKQVAIFDYKDRAGADRKVAELSAKKAGSTFFLQIVKEPMPEPPALEAVPV